MRRPGGDELGGEEQRFLYEHDRLELWDAAADPPSWRWYRKRLDVTFAALKRLPPGARVLDFGCAQGNVALMLAEEGFDVVAADLKPAFLAYARLKWERGAVRFVAANADAPPFKRVFDAVILGELLEHCAYPGRVLENAAALLAPGGARLVVVSTPNGAFVGNRLPTFSGVQDFDALARGQYKPDADGHLFLFTPAELKRLGEEAGLRCERLVRFGTPLVTGHFKTRAFVRRVPRAFNSLVNACDNALAALPLARTRLAEGLVGVFRGPPPPVSG